MNASERIQRLIRNSNRRALQEGSAVLLMMWVIPGLLQRTEAGSVSFYGCLILVVTSGIIAGVVWSFTLSHRLLRVHPATDTGFWQEAFQSQSRLLRLVPLWYLTPVCTGLLLVSARPNEGEAFRFMLGVVVVMFAVITWLNRRAAAKLEEDALALGAQPNGTSFDQG